LVALWRTRFHSLKNENVAVHAFVPGSAGKKSLLPEIVPLNAVDFAINLR
jgi:hypothetical protein